VHDCRRHKSGDEPRFGHIGACHEGGGTQDRRNRHRFIRVAPGGLDEDTASRAAGGICAVDAICRNSQLGQAAGIAQDRYVRDNRSALVVRNLEDDD